LRHCAPGGAAGAHEDVWELCGAGGALCRADDWAYGGFAGGGKSAHGDFTGADGIGPGYGGG